MTADIKRDKEKTGGTPALPVVPPAIHGEWQNFEEDDADFNDISAIINGNKAITGKAVYSANQAGRNVEQIETQRAEEKKREADIQEARELMHLAEWNGQMTNMGGVEMTNEEAQKARQRIIDNEVYYAHRAVAEGRIRAGEEDAYKQTVRRIKELEDKKGRGIATAAEQKESEDLKHSRLGRETERDAAKAYTEAKELHLSSDRAVDKYNAAHRNDAPLANEKDLFQSAPDLTKHHAQAMAALTPLDKTPDVTAAPLSPKLAASGFGV